MTRTMLVNYYATLGDGGHEVKISLELGSIDIKDEDLPKIQEGDIVPMAQLNYIRDQAIEFLEGIALILKRRKATLPEDFYTSLKLETDICRERIESARAYTIHKIQKIRLKESLVEHLFEEWMIFSIKLRNKAIYDYCSYLKDKVKDVCSLNSRKTRISA